jgi:CheY-like chemotaxis protein
LTILVVEDDAGDARLLMNALRRAGCAPLPVLNRAEEAVRYLEGAGEYAARDRHPLPALIVLDLNLPGMNGLEFLAWIRQQTRLSQIPVIVLSGSPFSPTIQKAYTLGAKTFFTKPLDSNALDQLAHAIVRYWCASASPAKGGRLGEEPGSLLESAA